MKTTNLIYFGSPQFSAQILESILSNPMLGLQVVAVVTNPDKAVGRKKILTPSPVAQVAQKHHLPTFKPRSLDEKNLLHLKLLKPDLFLVAAYGKIIPQNWLDLPKIAPLNIHFSLLPRYRGALCISEAIKNQDEQTGVTLMVIDQEMDHGPIVAQATEKIDLDDDVTSLTKKLTQKAIDLINQKLPEFLSGKITPKEQDHQNATYTPSYKGLTRDSAHIPIEELKQALVGQNAAKIHALIRSLNPEPGAWTKNKDLEFKLLKTSLNEGKLEIQTIQIPGKSPISYSQFLKGNPNLI